jgi:hypothetical protein
MIRYRWFWLLLAVVLVARTSAAGNVYLTPDENGVYHVTMLCPPEADLHKICVHRMDVENNLTDGLIQCKEGPTHGMPGCDRLSFDLTVDPVPGNGTAVDGDAELRARAFDLVGNHSMFSNAGIIFFGPPTQEIQCFDGVDDEGDGLTDCADPDCSDATGPTCDTGNAGICAAGTRTCTAGAEVCAQDAIPLEESLPAENCADGLDNDCDGLTDAADPDCLDTIPPSVPVIIDVSALRININGPDHDGIDFPGTWLGDPGVPGGLCVTSTFSNNSLDIQGSDDPLFQGEVYGNPVSCQIPVQVGNYLVNLYFAEIYLGPGCISGTDGTGQRVFDIALESATVLTGVDLFAEAGCGVPVVKGFDVSVQDGFLDIDLVNSTATVFNPKISAIEILQRP